MITQLLQRFQKREFSYICAQCGKAHKGAPSFSFQYPPYYYDVPEGLRTDCIAVTEDLCEINLRSPDKECEDVYCIRVVLEVPIHGHHEPFTWGVWVSQSQESFQKYVETFHQDQTALGSFGWLPVALPFYNTSEPGTGLEHLQCDVEWGSKGQRPKVLLWESEHPLSKDQRNGISWSKAQKIARVASQSMTN